MFQNWFTDKCGAYVGADGLALSGPALDAARRDPKAKKCGAKVKRRAKFCRACGSPAPAAWWRCGGCGKWIGQESVHCPHCGHAQDNAARVNLDNGVWRKGDDVFAQRFELNDMAGILERGLVIQEGQCAILLENGAIAEVLPPGRYPADDLTDMQTYLRSGDRKSLVMVELSEIAFPVMASGLRGKDDLEVALTCAVVLRFKPDCAAEFLTNVMGNHAYVASDDVNAVLGYGDLATNLLIVELEIAARDFCNEHATDELFKNPKLRLELEDRISAQLARNLDAAGLAFIRLTELEFHGVVIEKLREMAGSVEEQRREIEFRLRADELAGDETKRKAMGQRELEEYLARLAQEKEIKEYVRAEELERLNELWKQDRAVAELELKYRQAKKELTDVSELEKLQAEHDEALKRIVQNGEIERRKQEHALLVEQRLTEQNAALDYEKVEIAIQKLRSDAALELAGKKQQLEKQHRADAREDESERAKTLAGLDVMTRISLAKTPAEAHYLLKTLKAMQRDGKNPMQLLAEATADGSPEAAEALKNLSGDKIAMLEDVRRSERELMEKNQEMMERMFNKATDALSKSNQPGGNTTQIIK